MTTPDHFARELQDQGIQLTEQQTTQLTAYCEQLWEWNRRLNLTRHTDYHSFVTRDLHDSLHLAELLSPQEQILDVGSGGGVPGAVLAILRPDLRISLCEGTGRKAAALQSIVEAVSLDLPVLAARGEDVLRDESFDTVTARAVAPLAKLIRLFRPRRRSFQRMLLTKGPRWKSEQQEATAAGLMKGASLRVAAEYATVGHDGATVILELRF